MSFGEVKKNFGMVKKRWIGTTSSGKI
jgi:hypothetical protein